MYVEYVPRNAWPLPPRPNGERWEEIKDLYRGQRPREEPDYRMSEHKEPS